MITIKTVAVLGTGTTGRCVFALCVSSTLFRLHLATLNRRESKKLVLRSPSIMPALAYQSICRSAALKDAGEEYATPADMAKLFTRELSNHAAVMDFGGYGYCTDYPVERLLHDA